LTGYLFPPPVVPSLGILGEERRYAVVRIFCVGRNYEDHAREMEAAIRALLGLAPPRSLEGSSIADAWDWAIAHWDIRHVPKRLNLRLTR